MGMLREPLLNKRLVDKRLDVAPIPQAHAEALHRWAASIREGGIFSQTETGIRRPFLQMLFVDILGYTDFGSGVDWTLKDETSAGRGSMDVALGRFGAAREEIVAPFELKGPRTTDLDAIMPGRHKSPVQQAWEYAMDTPGCRYVLVSNMLEVRLYAVGHGRQAYEVWHLPDLIDPREYARLQLVLSAQNLLSGATDRLLGDSSAADKDITRELYRDYQKLRMVAARFRAIPRRGQARVQTGHPAGPARRLGAFPRRPPRAGAGAGRNARAHRIATGHRGVRVVPPVRPGNRAARIRAGTPVGMTGFVRPGPAERKANDCRGAPSPRPSVTLHDGVRGTIHTLPMNAKLPDQARARSLSDQLKLVEALWDDTADRNAVPLPTEAQKAESDHRMTKPADAEWSAVRAEARSRMRR